MNATESSSTKPQTVWQTALGELQLQMTKATFDTWVKQTHVVAYEDGTFIIGVHSGFAKDWLENRLHSMIQRTLTNIVNRAVEVRFVVRSPDNPTSEKETQAIFQPNDVPSPTKQTNGQPSCAINSNYTFERFIIGSSNRLAHAASLAVAESPAAAYNPLFLYGGVGLGKTHLLQAVANYALEQGCLVLYITSETFTNDLINAIRNKSTEEFRERYRNAEFLLVDDIQFIAGKESTQEEFFHTFNTLHGQDKQIVMTSDRPPKAMVTLEERLRSRFEWGLTADIQPPDFETRVAILRSKAERARYSIPAEIIEIIARKFQSNIRELEGALTRIVAYADLRGVPMTIELIDSALADLLPRRKDVQPDHVINTVADAYHLSPEQVTGRERTRQIALPRQIAMYLMREEGNISLPQIGESLGGRDHTTVMYGCDKIADLLERDDQLRRQVIEIREQLYGQSNISV